MHTLKLSACNVMLHDSIHTLPESQRVEYQYYHLIHSAVGSSLDDVDQHFQRQLMLVGPTDIEDQVNAINNLRFLFANILGKQIDPITLSLMCLVNSVDDVKCVDFSPDGVEKLATLLGHKGLTGADVEDTLAILAEKIEEELCEEFPKIFISSQTEKLVLQQKILILEVEELLNPDDPSLGQRRNSIDEDIRQNIKPPMLVGPKNQLKAIRSSYDNILIALQLEGLPVNENTTSLQFWKYYTVLESRSKSTPTGHRNHFTE